MKVVRKLYVSGKITGDRFYRKKFYATYDKLKEAGYFVELPMYAVPKSKGWQVDMKKALTLMLTCGGIALLPDWEESKGARIERQRAIDLGMPVKTVEEWVKR